jgi:hypothetical protein
MLNKQDLINLKDVIGDVVTEKLKLELGENFKERFEKVERNTDAACKVASDTHEELSITQSKVDDHETRMAILESHFART